MSYIRCLSNPESLYIYGTLGGIVCISGGRWRDGTQYDHTMPQDVWDGLCSAWVNQYDDEAEYKGASVVYGKHEDGADFKVRLSYDGWFIDMYDVTWAYITRRYEEDPPRRSWFSRLLRR